jgi:hypothetical protein
MSCSTTIGALNYFYKIMIKKTSELQQKELLSKKAIGHS